jgi:hypothetical protein
MHSRAIRRAQNRAEIVRVLHAIEDQHERAGLFGDDPHQIVLIERRDLLFGDLHMAVFAGLMAVLGF